MRKFTCLLMTASLIAAVSANAAVTNPFGLVKKHARHGMKMTPAKDSPADLINRILSEETEDATSYTFKPGTQTVYGWDGSDWDLDAIHTLKYDYAGRVTEEIIENYDGSYIRTSYAYNADGMKISELEEWSEDGVVYEFVSKTEREYDPIVKNLIVKNRQYYWENGEWNLSGNNYDRNVTRNELGNVTKVEIAVLFNGVYDPMDRIEITYGDNDQADSISEYVLDYDGRDFYWEEDNVICNIVWDRTDGQIVNMDSFGVGANRIKSADQVYDEEELVHVEFVYDGDNFIATLSGKVDGENLEAYVAYEQLDDFGSFRQTSTYVDGDYTEEETYTEIYDSYGNLLELKEAVSYYGEEEESEGMVGSVEYDPQSGYPLTYVLAEVYYDYDSGETITENMLKVEFSDYMMIVSGVDSVKTDAEEVAYYTLQGVKVKNPVSGNIYIRKQGGVSSKVIFR